MQWERKVNLLISSDLLQSISPTDRPRNMLRGWGRGVLPALHA